MKVASTFFTVPTRMRLIATILQTIFSVFFITASGSCGIPRQNLHDVYFANTEHELHVFRIYGKNPGKTIMLIGGIQGDEPGGYLTADLYADISLKKGNLIVVPRANFYSILLNQRDGLNGDMNRKFDEKDIKEKNMELEIVSILKGLISEADCLLNLHEGSGFYNDKYVDDNENPDRFGQSVIFDTLKYHSEKKKQDITLQNIVDQVISRANQQIENPRYKFHANNHDTLSPATKHPEQRKSATFYALTQAGIPAFGIETSKSIKSIPEKVSLQKIVVNSFMQHFDIIPDTPGPLLEPTKLDYVLVKVNDGYPFAVPNGATLEVTKGDEVVITDIIANYSRGLAADFIGMGSYNDTRLPFRISNMTKIAIRKDAETCGMVQIGIKGQKILEKESSLGNTSEGPKTIEATEYQALKLKEKAEKIDLKAVRLILNTNGKTAFVKEGEEMEINKDKMLILKGVQSNDPALDSKICVNLKGFAPPKASNSGNDLNLPIFPAHNLWKRYSENKDGLRYLISASYQNKDIGKFWIKLK